MAFPQPSEVVGERQGEETASRVLDAAEACFRRAGYAGTSMREIAAAAGVSKSLLHHHFESKEHLFIAVQMQVYERLAERATRAASTLGSGGARGLQGLDLLFAALRETNDLSLHAEVLARAVGSAHLRTHMVRLRTHLKGLLRETLTRLLGSDQQALAIDIDTTCEVLWAALSGLALQAALGEDPARVAQALGGLRRIGALAFGLGAGLESPGREGGAARGGMR